VTGQFGIALNLLHTPYGLAFDSSNALYIADAVNNRTQKWPMGATAGTLVAGELNGALGTTAYDLDYPVGLYIDSNDNIYIADELNSRIQLWTKGASSGQTVAGNSSGKKIKYHKLKNFFFYQSFVFFYTYALTGFVGSGNNQLDGACAITGDPSSGALYITDTYNHRVMRYLTDQTSGTLILGGQGAGTNSTQLNIPVGIYFDAFTNSLFIANYGANNIVRWAFNTNTQTVVAGDPNGSNGTSSALFYGPITVTLDPMGNMYVVDSINHRIQMFLVGQSNGTTIAGMCGTPGTNATLLSFPHWVILDKQLNLYVSDSGNQRVQKFARY
jgi:DNA-binding beta-propeller fold protein YncE